MSRSRPRFLSAIAGCLLLPCAWLALCVFAWLIADPAAAQEARVTDGAAIQPGAIEGTLFPPPDTQGKSAEGITVTINETGQSVDTDKHGKYSFENVKPGTYTLIASGSGYSRLRITDVVVKPNRTLTLSSEAMPMVMKDGEVQVMAEVVVNANKEIQTLEKLVVTDSKPAPFTGTNNIDLPRTVDDVQPYYMWNSTQIENSGAADIQDFFQKQVPMDTNKTSNTQNGAQGYPSSNLSLNGLSGNQTNSGTQNTLILLNGLPLPSFSEASLTYEPNVDGIPLAAIDHIEVLPSSASAIYGANATGGVINIVLKHDYSGAELNWTYNNTFGTDAPIRNLSLTWGASLEGGKTSFLLTMSDQTQKPLELQDRMQVAGPNDALYYSLYPGGQSAFLGLTTSTGAPVTTAPTVELSTPLVRSANNTPLIPGTTATQLQIPAGYQSFSASGLGPLQANIGQYNLSRTNNGQQTGQDGLKIPLTVGPMEKGIQLLVRRQMTPWLELFGQFGNDGASNINYVAQDYFINVTVPATAPGNPFGQAVLVSSGNAWQDFPEYLSNSVSRTVSAGAKLTLPWGWKAELDYTWGSNSFSELEQVPDTTALQAGVTSGMINVISDLSQNPLNAASFREYIMFNGLSTLNTLQFKAAGPLMKLWAGAPTFAWGVSRQADGNQSNHEYLTYPGRTVYPVAANSILTEDIYFPGQREAHDSGYAELDMPLVAKSNGIFGVRQFEFQAVGRYDSFEEFTTSPVDSIVENLVNGSVVTSPDYLGTTTPEAIQGNPEVKYHATSGTVGFKYHPVDDLFFRWSYTTGYDTPSFSQLLSPISQGTQTEPTTPANEINPAVPTTSPWAYQAVADPASGSTYFVPVETGGNPNITPEKSHAIDWGIVVEPKFLPGLRIAVDYTKVTKFNDIVTPSVATLLQYASQFPGRVVRSSPNGPITFINDTYLNAPETYTSSYNLAVDYTLKTAALGTWTLAGIANSWQHYDIQSVVGGPFVEQLGNPAVSTITTSGVNYGQGVGTAKFKGNLSLSWSKGPYFAGWTAQYIGPYVYGSYYGLGGPNQYATGTVGGWISGQIYHDVYIGYRVGKVARTDAWWNRALANSSIRLGVNNVFDHIPPYDGGTGIPGYPVLYSAYGDIRLATYILSVKKGF